MDVTVPGVQSSCPKVASIGDPRDGCSQPSERCTSLVESVALPAVRVKNGPSRLARRKDCGKRESAKGRGRGKHARAIIDQTSNVNFAPPGLPVTADDSRCLRGGSVRHGRGDHIPPDFACNSIVCVVLIMLDHQFLIPSLQLRLLGRDFGTHGLL